MRPCKAKPLHGPHRDWVKGLRFNDHLARRRAKRRAARLLRAKRRQRGQ